MLKKPIILFQVAVLFFGFSTEIFAKKPEIQLPNIYHKHTEINDFLISEKLDGVRGYWSGSEFISRQGIIINAPQWFVKDFPKTVLDGELWVGRERFDEVSQIIRCQSCDNKNWQKVKFMIFDLPKSSKIFFDRYKEMQKIVKNSNSKYLQIIEQFEVLNEEELYQILNKITLQKGEGVILHKKKSLYKATRNDDLLKLKKFDDMEGVVIAHIAGKGKFVGKMGAVLVEIIDDNQQKIHFKIGSGFSIKERENPPKIGSIITFKFYGKTKNNIPRFASFWRERNE